MNFNSIISSPLLWFLCGLSLCLFSVFIISGSMCVLSSSLRRSLVSVFAVIGRRSGIDIAVCGSGSGDRTGTGSARRILVIYELVSDHR